MARSGDNLYHYTTPGGKEGILGDRRILPSANSAKFGSGVYFTSLRPKNESTTIKKSIYDGWRDGRQGVDDRLQWAVVVPREGLMQAGYKVQTIKDPKNKNADIFRVPGSQGVDLNRLAKFNVNPRQ